MDLAHSIVRTDDQLTIELTGDIDMTTADELCDVMLAALGTPGITAVNIDLHHVTFIDSSAIGALVSGLKAAEEAGRSFQVDRPQGAVHRVLDIAGVLPALRASE